MEQQNILPTPHWYVVYTCPQAEKTVYAKAQQLGFEALLPLQREVRQWSDRKKTVEVPMFPNYVFVRVARQHRFRLLEIRGVVNFVSFGSELATVSDQEIVSIRQLSLHPTRVSSENFCQVGERVIVTQGQFTGTQGVLVREDGGDKIVIQIRALRQALAIKIAKENVRPVAEVAARVA